MTVNGKSTRSCSRPLKPGESLLIEPMWGFPIIKDLAVDFGTSISTPEGIFRKMEGIIIRKQKQSADIASSVSSAKILD
jgi:succinate dehydrogenase/fumarate reductase-like Fe-S protein